MAPLKLVKDGLDQRVQTVLNLAKKALSHLEVRESIPASLKQELDHAVKRWFPLHISPTIAGKLSEIDTLGCDLWNAATNILRDDQQLQEDGRLADDTAFRLIPVLRTFAFLLLDTAHHATVRRSKDMSQQVRNLKTGLKACRFCLDQNELELALKLLERCAEHISAEDSNSPLVHMSHSTDDHKDWKAELPILFSQYYLLRITHAWKSDRQDLAEHFFGKFSTSSADHASSLAEMLAKLCYDAGKSMSRHGSTELSTKWMRRALAALDACDIEQLSPDASDLRLSIVSALVENLLSMHDADSLASAQVMVERLDSEHGLGNRMTVQLMYLKIVLRHQPPDLSKVGEVMVRLLSTAVLTERTFKLAMQAIHRVQKANVKIARDALEQFITARLIPDISGSSEADGSMREWIEKACVTYTLFTTSDTESGPAEAIKCLENLFNALDQRAGKTLGPKATHAIQMLIWKATSAAEPDVADNWCKLMRHPLFDGAGQVNKARISRKVMNMAIAKGDLEAARTAFFEMPAAAQNENITRYLAFRLAVRSNDYDFAIESLQIVLKHADRDATFLYACALEAQQSQMRHIAVAALQAILDQRPPGIHLPSLLRCTARLLIGELNAPSRDSAPVIDETVRIFEAASVNLVAFKQVSNEQWRSEIQWWSKNAYNLSLKLCGQMHPELLIQLLQACVKFIEAYRHDGGPVHDDDLDKRQSLCHFLSASALVVLSRSEAQGSERSLQWSLQARQQIAAFKLLQRKQDFHQSTTESNYRAFELLKFDLECILNLQQWKELGAVFQACLQFENVDSWDALADIVLIIHQQIGPSGLQNETNSGMMELLDRIINDTWQRHKDITKASRWLRLSFSLDLTDGDGDFALKLLVQAAGMAKKQQDKQKEAFPETELQWLAITAFNKAIDLLSVCANEACMQWIEGALELARYAGDGGALHANLTDKKERVIQRMREDVV